MYKFRHNKNGNFNNMGQVIILNGDRVYILSELFELGPKNICRWYVRPTRHLREVNSKIRFDKESFIFNYVLWGNGGYRNAPTYLGKFSKGFARHMEYHVFAKLSIYSICPPSNLSFNQLCNQEQWSNPCILESKGSFYL